MEKVNWTIFDTGVNSACENMAIDHELLLAMDQHSLPVLHFYDWSGNCATYGYFIDPAKFLDLKRASSEGLSLAKRPTGGGIVFHIWDFAFSVCIPASHPYYSANTLDNYAFINQLVLSAVVRFLKKRGSPQLIDANARALDDSCAHFCMARPTKYDVVLDGKKIAGAAQRQTKKGFLHQGTIALQVPCTDYLSRVLLPRTQVLNAILAHTFPLLSPNEDLKQGRTELKQILQNTFTNKYEHVTKS